jgi:hypothetical protein
MSLNSDFYLSLWKGGRNMKGMTFKKAFLLGGIFLLATFMLVQLSWGCDDDDKLDRDCHDKLQCDQHGKPCHPPKIQSVDVDLENKTIVIYGENFKNGVNPPVVSLGGSIILNIVTYTEINIVAELPALNDIPNSDYRLVVSTCHDSACNDKYCKDHGPNCKCEYCKDHCSKCNDKYSKDYEYKCRCKEGYSLTIAGPPGPPSPITLTRIGSTPVTLTPAEDATDIDERAVCPVGWLVTGGGFSCPKCISIYLSIKVNEPLQDLSGWHVVGIYYAALGDPADLTIYAICTQAQQVQ